jgi:hypothetical protein
MGFEVSTAVRVYIVDYWVFRSDINPEDAGNMFLRFVSVQPEDYKIQQPSRPHCKHKIQDIIIIYHVYKK